MKKKAVVFGLHNFAQIFYLHYKSSYEAIKNMPEICAFTVDSEYKTKDTFCGLPVCEFENLVSEFPPDVYSMFILIGYKKMNQNRKETFGRVTNLGYELPNFIHPTANLFADDVGDGNILFPGAMIDLCAVVGDGNIMISGSSFGHHGELGNYNYFASNATVAGHTKIEDCCYLGLNSSITNKIELGSKTYVAAGVTLSESTKEGTVVLPYHKATILEGKSHLVEF
ncbi:hypothetical protein AGMMS49975_00250 [Clostridia bacterium]|nr:hypothetical protein AGMMS49975_00250 [Clostridia bacterium]